MFEEENQLKNADEYRIKMQNMVKDCEAGNVGAISCHHAGEFFEMIDVSSNIMLNDHVMIIILFV